MKLNIPICLISKKLDTIKVKICLCLHHYQTRKIIL